VNLAVTALLMVWLLDDLERRDESLRAARRQREERIYEKFEQLFDGFLSVDMGADEKNVARAVQLLARHPMRALLQDGVVWQDPRPSAELSAGSVLPSEALFLNVPGAKHRAATYDERRARRLMTDALRLGRIVPETEPTLRGWVAAPIRAVSSGGERRPDAPLWGAGYFLLDVPREPEWQPFFQPRTLLVGTGVGTLLLLAFTWFLLERSVLQPMAELSAGAARVKSRSYEVAVPGAGRDEVGKVVGAFNEMMAQVGDAERRLTAEVAEATRRAEERGRGLIIAQRLAATGTLASGIAHEINNPLGGMLNAALKLKEEAQRAAEPSAAGRVRYLQLLVDGLSRIQQIVKRVLLFTPRRVEPQVMPILDLVRQSVAFAEHQAKRARVAITVAGPEAPVLVEPGEMQQVFLNLVLNAVDAIAGHADHGTIAIRAERVDGRVRVVVADDGPGMSDEQQARCFDLFFTTKEPGKGTGLGLSVAHHIVEQHGGTIGVESTPGHGTRFTLTLPLARVG